MCCDATERQTVVGDVLPHVLRAPVMLALKTESLAHMSPRMVSSCGVAFVGSRRDWEAVVSSELSRGFEYGAGVRATIRQVFGVVLPHMMKNCEEFHQSESPVTLCYSAVITLRALLQASSMQEAMNSMQVDATRGTTLLVQQIIFSTAWAFVAGIEAALYSKVESVMQSLVEPVTAALHLGEDAVVEILPPVGGALLFSSHAHRMETAEFT